MAEQGDKDAADGAAYEITDRTKMKRYPKRAVHDKAPIHAILDEGLVCHVGFVADGQQYVIPTAYARIGETLYIHGSAVSRMLKTLAGGVSVCITVTLLDGLVLARSVYNTDMRFRSVCALGTAHLVADKDEKAAALQAMVEALIPHRNKDPPAIELTVRSQARQPSNYELKATSVLALPLTEVSAKVSAGWPNDDKEDLDLPIWAGVLPITQVIGAPEADELCQEKGFAVPDYVSSYQRPSVL